MKKPQLLPGYNNIETILNDLRNKSENYWQERGDKQVLKLFHQASQRVPAYKDFLKAHKVNPDKIKKISDYKLLPAVDKQNYLLKYPRQALCWNGKFSSRQSIISTTSGSTGEPFYFPREEFQDLQYTLTAELYLRNNFKIQNRTTLYVNAFALGAWIGGLFTFGAITALAKRGKYSLSIINPGLNKAEAINSIQKLGTDFDQVIIGGYPPFVKDILDEGKSKGIDWAKFNLKFVFSAEGFNEKFRDYIIKLAGAADPCIDTLNHYGTVDLGTMAHETPCSIAIRRVLLKNQKLYKNYFDPLQPLPTLTQFIPEMFYFEEYSKELLCTGNGGFPLIRYNLKDKGAVIPFSQLLGQKSENTQWVDSMLNGKLKNTIWQLPFVAVYGRGTAGLSWNGATIHSEHIKSAHQHRRLIPHLTGKFTMEAKYDKNMNPILNIHSELKKGVKASAALTQQLKDRIIKTLLSQNSEYKNNYAIAPKKNTPRIVLWLYESRPYFLNSNKQKWVIK